MHTTLLAPSISHITLIHRTSVPIRGGHRRLLLRGRTVCPHVTTSPSPKPRRLLFRMHTLHTYQSQVRSAQRACAPTDRVSTACRLVDRGPDCRAVSRSCLSMDAITAVKRKCANLAKSPPPRAALEPLTNVSCFPLHANLEFTQEL